ncbi:MAG: helix-turn-helix transcriptional regulator [Anaerolineae bacterium]|nr:helix-turn-helix transcriptional regulator [Anaerolineae bacterium]
MDIMSQNNRVFILHHALNLFATRGYDAVGVQEIAEAAGVTKPTLYHYFGNKHRLLDTLLAENLDAFIAQIKDAACYRGDLPLTLATVTSTCFLFAKQHPVLYRLQLAMCFAPPDSDPARAIRPYNETQYRLLEDLFKRAAEDHGNMRGRHRRYAVTFRGMIDTYIGLYLNGYVRLNDEVLYQAVHQFMHGIYS